MQRNRVASCGTANEEGSLCEFGARSGNEDAVGEGA